MNSIADIDPIVDRFFNHPLFKKRPLPFSPEQVLAEKDVLVAAAMTHIDGLFGMKLLGKSFEHLQDEEHQRLLSRALSILCEHNKLNKSQGVAICKQLCDDNKQR